MSTQARNFLWDEEDVQLEDDVRAASNPCHDPSTGEFCNTGGHAAGTALIQSYINTDADADFDAMRDPSTPSGKTLLRELGGLPNHSGTVYRGTALTADELQSIRTTKTFDLKLTSSSSKDVEVAFEFVRGGQDKVPVLFELRVKRGKDVSKLASGQEEVMLPAGMKFTRSLGLTTFNLEGRRVTKVTLEEL